MLQPALKRRRCAGCRRHWPRAAGDAQSKWYQWRKSGTALIAYLLDSEVHTFAFSVAANAIISFIPFVVLLYTLALRVFHSPGHGRRGRTDGELLSASR
jgi:hypothetical protein